MTATETEETLYLRRGQGGRGRGAGLARSFWQRDVGLRGRVDRLEPERGRDGGGGVGRGQWAVGSEEWGVRSGEGGMEGEGRFKPPTRQGSRQILSSSQLRAPVK